MDWKVKKGADEYPCPDASTLKQWASEGRILAEDYIFNPVLNQWLYARDVAEIQPFFHQKKQSTDANKLNTVGLIIGITGIVIGPFAPPLGGLLIFVGLGFAIAYYVKRPAK